MKKRMYVMLLALSMALSLGACGAAAGGQAYDAAAADENGFSEMKEEIADADIAEDDYATDDSGDAPADAPADNTTQERDLKDAADAEHMKESSEKIIYTYNYSVETKTFEELMQHVQQRVDEYGGYIESSEINGNPEMNIRRYAQMIIRVPAEKMHEFLEMVTSKSNVTYSSTSSENVTLSYVDMQSHVEALKTEQKSLMDMLEHADTIEAIIAIQSQLTNVRYELESYESQLRIYDNRINYSTLYLDINEVDRESSVATKLSYGEEISQGISNTMYDLGQGLRDLSIWFIVNLPILLLLAVLLVIAFFIGRALVKRSAKRKARGAAGVWTSGTDENQKKKEANGKEANGKEANEKEASGEKN